MGSSTEVDMDQQDRYLTVEQVAERLQVHEETVRRWLRAGLLRGHVISRRAGWRIRESEVDRFASGEEPDVKLAA
jgi:excisionase family DNA binding protein